MLTEEEKIELQNLEEKKSVLEQKAKVLFEERRTYLKEIRSFDDRLIELREKDFVEYCNGLVGSFVSYEEYTTDDEGDFNGTKKICMYVAKVEFGHESHTCDITGSMILLYYDVKGDLVDSVMIANESLPLCSKEDNDKYYNYIHYIELNKVDKDEFERYWYLGNEMMTRYAPFHE